MPGAASSGRSQRHLRCGCFLPRAPQPGFDSRWREAARPQRSMLAAVAASGVPGPTSGPITPAALPTPPSGEIRACCGGRGAKPRPRGLQRRLQHGRAALTTAHDSGGRSVAATAHAQLIASGVRARHRSTTGFSTRNDAAAPAGGRVQPRSAQEARCKNGGGHSRAPRLKKWGGGTARAPPAGGEAKGTAVRHHGQ